MSKLLSLFGICLTLMLMLVTDLSQIGAATPTPTPTLRPIPMSPTSAYIYLRPTPTPFTITTSPFTGAFLVDAGPIADNAIGIWNFANRDHVLDFVVCGAIVMSIVVLMLRLVARYNKEAINQG